ncbi:MAG TPA: DUF5343 domain-containing protein [Streptosporangiaceae bacterium]|nr:DUF5343 domain-containing protein [Streptosporangiaceae bacterium]
MAGWARDAGGVSALRIIAFFEVKEQMAIPAVIATNAIPRFLESIPKVGVPEKVDGNYLKSLGFKNSNDMALVPLFKSLGFLDSGGKPTSIYRDYRAADAEEAKRILGTAIRTFYSGLFMTYPDAHRKDDEALANWMRANTDKGAATQGRALRTFKVLRDSASFDEAPQAQLREPSNAVAPSNGAQGSASSARIHTHAQATPEVTINITLQIAATDDASIYDKFFASMKKHLFSDES